MRRSTVASLMLCSVLIAIVTAYYTWPQLRETILLRSLYHDDARMWRTPIPLPDNSISQVAHRKIAAQGYEFELPWDDVASESEMPFKKFHLEGAGTSISFASGNSMSFSTTDLIAAMSPNMANPPGPLQGEGLGKTLSDYDFRREMLDTTPAQLTPFLSRSGMNRVEELLVRKWMFWWGADGIYEFQSPLYRGFQFEDLHGRLISIRDQIFGPDGMVEITFDERGPGLAPVLSQPEINRVLQSIHKIPAPPPSQSRP